MKTLTDNLVRVRPDADSARARSEDGVLFGHFSVFDAWYEVNSVFEGRFMERTVTGAFDRTLQARADQIKAQYQHGKDTFVGASLLGPFTQLREDSIGGFYEIDLIDTDYNRDRIIPQARAGLLGASFRFSVADGGEQWVEHPKKSDHNPIGLPERTITNTHVYELGPVVFGASPSATAAMRSGTDEFINDLLGDPLFLARFTERAGIGVVEKLIASLPPDGRNDERKTPRGSADGQDEGSTPGERDAFFRSLQIKESP